MILYTALFCESPPNRALSIPQFFKGFEVRQLALAYQVYPGAVHTRFEHSLGAFHIACKVAKQLGFSSEQARLVRLSALLHDVGHGPFSRVSEPILKKYATKKKINLGPKQQVHELITAQILRTNDELGQWILKRPNRINFARGRIYPSFQVDASAGAEVYKSERMNVRFQLDGQNLTNVLQVIDFGGLFSGNAIGPSRSVAMRLTTSF